MANVVALERAASRILAIAAALAGAGCLVEIDYSNTAFRCDTRQECPDGYTCDGMLCTIGGADAAPDGEIDASALTCGDDFCTETCASCIGDCGACFDDMVVYMPGDDEADDVTVDASLGGHVIELANVGRVDSARGRAYVFDGTDEIQTLAAL